METTQLNVVYLHHCLYSLSKFFTRLNDMDAILELQERKQEIEQQNAIANMLVSLKKAFEEYIVILEKGDKNAEFQIPFLCKIAMNMSGNSNVYVFIDTLRYSLSDYLSSILLNGYSTQLSCITVRSYTGKDVELSSWISEVSDLLDSISSWRDTLSDRVFRAKYQ